MTKFYLLGLAFVVISPILATAVIGGICAYHSWQETRREDATAVLEPLRQHIAPVPPAGSPHTEPA